MADYCESCQPGCGDLVGLCAENETLETICEGCGHTTVDSKGRCFYAYCPEHWEQARALAVAEGLMTQEEADALEPPDPQIFERGLEEVDEEEEPPPPDTMFNQDGVPIYVKTPEDMFKAAEARMSFPKELNDDEEAVAARYALDEARASEWGGRVYEVIVSVDRIERVHRGVLTNGKDLQDMLRRFPTTEGVEHSFCFDVRETEESRKVTEASIKEGLAAIQDLDGQIAMMVKRDSNKIPAIKWLRTQVRGIGLKEAKDIVDRIVDGKDPTLWDSLEELDR